MAVVNYHATYGCYPPAFIANEQGRPMHSWRVLILPFIDQKNLYDQYRFDEPWDGPNNRQLAQRMPRMFAFSNRDEPDNVTTNYLRVVGPATASPGGTTVRESDVRDGIANTLFIVENLGEGVHWMEPRDLSFDSMSLTINDSHGISSWYTQPAGVTLEDSVRMFPLDAAPDAIKALFTIDGGEQVADDWRTWQPLADGRLRPKAPATKDDP